MRPVSERHFVKIVVSILSMAVVFGVASNAVAGAVTYTYDALGRIVSATYSTGVVVTYTYDANGNRVQKVVSGA